MNRTLRGWEDTLTGLPKELLEFWRKHLKKRGYKLHVQIVEFPGGVPGMTIVKVIAVQIIGHLVSAG